MTEAIETARPSKRPLRVVLAGIYTCVCGILIVLVGLAFLGVAGLAGVFGLTISGTLAAVSGALLLTLGLVTFVSGLGLFRFAAWAWWIALISTVVSLVVVGLAGQVQIGDVLILRETVSGVIIKLVLIALLVVVRRHFGIRLGKPQRA